MAPSRSECISIMLSRNWTWDDFPLPTASWRIVHELEGGKGGTTKRRLTKACAHAVDVLLIHISRC